MAMRPADPGGVGWPMRRELELSVPRPRLSQAARGHYFVRANARISTYQRGTLRRAWDGTRQPRATRERRIDSSHPTRRTALTDTASTREIRMWALGAR
jgi:hypothetical protein